MKTWKEKMKRDREKERRKEEGRRNCNKEAE